MMRQSYNKMQSLRNGMKGFVLSLLLFCSTTLLAQSGIEITGVISDDMGGLPGATVKIKGTTNGVLTDVNGEYKLTVPSAESILQISYLGFVTQEVVVNDQKTISVTLREEATQLNEVVVVGYGTMKKRDVTGAITSISSKDIENRLATNVFEAMQGQTAGVQIVSGSGQPGEGSSIRIRGTSSFSDGAVNPLYIVDGAPMDNIDAINPSDIESLEVLKDAASAAIYGSRSANGVIIITTKQGSKNKPIIDIKYDHSWGTLAHKLPQANTRERRLYDTKRRDFFLKYRPGNADESIEMLNDSLNVFFNVDNDYQKLGFKTAQKDQLDLSIGGGSDNLKYFINTGYFSEKGIIDRTGYDRLTARVNSDYKASDLLSMGTRVSIAYSKRKGIDEGSFLNSMLTRRPYFSLYYPDGDMVGIFNGQKSPIAQTRYTRNNKEDYTLNFFQFVQLNLTKNLKYRTNLSLSYAATKFKKMTPSILYDENQSNNRGESLNYMNWNWMNEHYLTYNNKFNKVHNVSAMLGVSAQKWSREDEILVGTNSPTDIIYMMNAFAADLDLTKTGTWKYGHSLASIFARMTYDYKGKYLMTANFRRDGSSRFPSKNRWGNFPSISAGWRFSDEKFMTSTKSYLDDAKLRVSYGVTGNEQIGNYDYLMTYSLSTIYDGVGGVGPSRLNVNDLSWEETSQVNTGLDLSFFKSRLVITADYYDKYTKDLLARYQVPKEWGYDFVMKNIGEVRNRGFEFAISGDIIRSKDFTWNMAFNISKNTTKIEKLAGGVPYIQSGLWRMEEGGKIGDFYGYKALNVFQYSESNAFTDDWKQLTPVFENGTFQNQYLLNGEVYTGTVNQKKMPDGRPFRGGDINWEEAGEPDGVINSDDRKVLGNAQPDFTGGLNTNFTYKNWGLFVSFYYSIGGDLYNFARQDRNSFRFTGTTPEPEVIYNLWTKEGDAALYPRPFNDEFDNARLGQGHSFYVEDGSFLKLRNVRLSYDVPQQLLNVLKMKRLGLYAYINNALTWTKYKGYDPEFSNNSALEMGRDNNRYPRKREFGVGFTMNF